MANGPQTQVNLTIYVLKEKSCPEIDTRGNQDLQQQKQEAEWCSFNILNEHQPRLGLSKSYNCQCSSEIESVG